MADGNSKKQRAPKNGRGRSSTIQTGNRAGRRGLTNLSRAERFNLNHKGGDKPAGGPPKKKNEKKD